MKKLKSIVLIFMVFLLSCTTNSKEETTKTIDNRFDNIQNRPTIITGKILNMNVYPNIKEIKLTIPGFKGDQEEISTEITDSGQFTLVFYPKTNREIVLYPIEDILIVQPGDSLYISKDFKDIGNTSFNGDRADLNRLVSKFRGFYLGRYSIDYTKPYLFSKKSCEIEKRRNIRKLKEFQENNPCTDEFNNWALKLIELNYCTTLFDCSSHYLEHSNFTLMNLLGYFSFINGLETKMDNSIVMADYFSITDQYVNYQLVKLNKKYKRQIEKKDTIVDLMLEDIFSSTRNNYLAQFAMCSFLSTSLNSNKTDMVHKCQDQINQKLNDAFLKRNLQEHYDRMNELDNGVPLQLSNERIQ